MPHDNGLGQYRGYSDFKIVVIYIFVSTLITYYIHVLNIFI